MYEFEADPRDGFGNGSNGRSGSSRGNTCNSCCEETAEAIPGETNLWRISYACWLSGMRGRGLYAIGFSFIKLTPNPAPPIPSMLPPTNIDYVFQIEENTSFSGTVSTNANSPQASPLTFALDPVNPPSHGIVAMNSNGTFVYVPSSAYTGIDTFGFVTTDGVNMPVENIVTFGVDTEVAVPFSSPFPAGVIDASGSESAQQVYETPLPPGQGLIFVPPQSVRLAGFHAHFALTTSPETLIGQIYRMTVAASALECNKQTFRHISSYDIRISSCGLP